MKINDRTGESRIMKCGMKATIITYRNANNIDVQFEDGTIVKQREYKQFCKGSILHPVFSVSTKSENRLGKTKKMKCNMKATIIAYRKFHDIDVQFEDGAIVKHRSYDAFCNGGIKNPNLKSIHTKLRLGETRIMNCGMKATIIVYRKFNDIDVQFEDGAIVKQNTYEHFCNGGIRNPNIIIKRIGKTRMMNCGMKATIIVYRQRSDIDVQFEDGTIVTHRSYSSFCRGEILHPFISKAVKSFIIAPLPTENEKYLHSDKCLNSQGLHHYFRK